MLLEADEADQARHLPLAKEADAVLLVLEHHLSGRQTGNNSEGRGRQTEALSRNGGKRRSRDMSHRERERERERDST